jgi:hypothetical protein
MPGTGPEAAKLAGLPYDEHRLRTDPEYNNALGTAYFTAQLERFGDPALAAAAYNAGPGRVQRALRVSQRTGRSWQELIPTETQKYVESFTNRVGSSGVAMWTELLQRKSLPRLWNKYPTRRRCLRRLIGRRLPRCQRKYRPTVSLWHKSCCLAAILILWLLRKTTWIRA